MEERGPGLSLGALRNPEDEGPAREIAKVGWRWERWEGNPEATEHMLHPGSSRMFLGF